MNEPSPQHVFAEVLPQVGAVLHLDTALPQSDPQFGNEYWALDGSCAVVAPDRVLTIRHTIKDLGDLTRTGIFLPYEGIFKVVDVQFQSGRDRDRDFDSEKYDNLALLTLDRKVRHAPGFGVRKIPDGTKDSGFAFIGGYGCWDAEPFGDRDGLQRRVWVRLGMPDWDQGSHIHYDNLDLAWWSPWNDGRRALLNNSGGPMLWISREARGFDVVGINRETKGSQQIGSWIGWDRFEWLHEVGVLPSVDRSVAPKAVGSKVLQVGQKVEEARRFEIVVPEDATRILLTLNATAGLRLQMGVEADPGDGFLDRLAGSNLHSGRFLFREHTWEDRPPRLVIGVSHVARAFPEAEAVTAQLCWMFV